MRMRKDGTRVPVRIWGAPMSDGIGYLAVLADLSDAKRAEREHATIGRS